MVALAGTVVVLAGLVLTFQLLRAECGTPAHTGTEVDAPAVPAPPEAVRLAQPAPAPLTPVRPEPQARLLEPEASGPAVESSPRVNVARWPLGQAKPAVVTAAKPAVTLPSRLGPVQAMPALAAAPHHRSAARALVLPLTGTHPCLLEDHGALVLPPDVRQQLGTPAPRTLFVTPGPEASLWLFTGAGLERWADDPDRTSSVRAREARRRCLAQTEACAVDRSGRVHLPEHLAQLAGLRQDAVLLGVGDHLELWDAERWLQYREH
jgi:MraZ protein